jgi:lysophospholipase L1-like esterase
MGSQLAFALHYLHAHKNVRLVSLMIGANDVFVCQATTKDACSSKSELAGVFTTLAHNVHVILSAIRKKAHYRGQLAIVNYYSLNYGSPTLTALSAAGNQAVDAAAKPFHVVVADGFGEFQAAALHSSGNPCFAGLLTQVGGSSCGIHPSYAGQSLLAQALEKVIRL